MTVEIMQIYMGIHISKVLGSEGTGIFQLTQSIFGLVSTIGLGGYHIAVTRLSAKYSREGGVISAEKSVKKTMLVSLITTVTACIAIFVFGDNICLKFIGIEKMSLPLKIMALTLPLSGIIICFNSYCIYFDKIKTLGTVSILTQIIDMFFTFKLIKIFNFSVAGKCIAISFAALISTFASFLMGMMFFLIPMKKRSKTIIKPYFSEIVSIILPIALSGSLRSFLNMLQNMLIPWGLVKFGLNKTEAMQNYGIIKGMAIPVIVFPAALMSSFLTLLIPEISKAYENSDKDKIGRAVVKSSSVTIIFSIILTAIYIIFGNEMGVLIYNSEKVGKYIRILAPLTTFMFLDDVVDSALKGINKQMKSLQINIVESASRVFLLFILIPRFGIVGYVFVIFFGNILNFAMSYISLEKASPVYMDFKNWIIKPAVVAISVSFISKFIFYHLKFGISSFSLVILFSIALYMFICINLGCFKGVF